MVLQTNKAKQIPSFADRKTCPRAKNYPISLQLRCLKKKAVTWIVSTRRQKEKVKGGCYGSWDGTTHSKCKPPCSFKQNLN